jgi:glycosyltransferase involved in cell wall biosynthesis
VTGAASPADRPVRVLMITSDHLMIDRRILQEAHTLRDAGYAMEIIAGFDCPDTIAYEQEGLRITRFRFDGTDTRVDWLLRLLWWASEPLREVLRRFGRRVAAMVTGSSSLDRFVVQKILACSYDILHCHDFPLLAAAVEAKRRRPTPLVYDAHELYYAQSVLPALTQARYRRRERRLIGHADLAITVNSFIANKMAAEYGCAMPEVIFNAAPRRPMVAWQEGLRELLHIGKAERIVIYQGWMSPERGLDRLVRAARHFSADVRLVLIGYGDYEQTLRRISAEQGTEDGRVIFAGRIAAEDLPPLTRSADLGVIPYYGVDLNNYYSSPNKLFEYAAAGLPFVSNDLPFLRSIIDRYKFGVVADLTEPARAACAILSILNDPDRLKALRHAAERAGAELSWNKEGEKLLGLYEKIVLPRLRHGTANSRRG